MTAPQNPRELQESLERLRSAEAALRRSEKIATALHIVFFVTWLSILWSCRNGCSESSWFLVAVYPVILVFYLIDRRRIKRRILSEMPEYQEALAEQQKERDRHQNQ